MKKYFVFVVGTIFIAIGVNFVINSKLGVSPISLLPYVISLSFPKFSFGFYTFIINIVYYLVQVIGLGKSFSKLQHGQIAMGLIFGLFIDLTSFILLIDNSNIFMQVINFIIGGYFLASGILILFIANVSYSNAEGMMKFIANKWHFKFGVVKIVVDLLHVLVSLLILLIFYDKIVGIGIGTLILVLFIGPLIDKMEPMYTKWIMRYLNG